jgi:ArsR family transcriptional regulator
MKHDPTFYEIKSEFCKSLSHPVRLQVLETLAEGERSFAALIEATGETKVNLSRHLTILTSRGIVRRRRVGKHIYLSITNPKIVQACQLMTEMLQEHLARDMSVVNAGPPAAPSTAPATNGER